MIKPWYQNDLPRTHVRNSKGTAPMYGWDCPLLIFIYPGLIVAQLVRILCKESCWRLLFDHSSSGFLRSLSWLTSQSVLGLLESWRSGPGNGCILLVQHDPSCSNTKLLCTFDCFGHMNHGRCSQGHVNGPINRCSNKQQAFSKATESRIFCLRHPSRSVAACLCTSNTLAAMQVLSTPALWIGQPFRIGFLSWCFTGRHLLAVLQKLFLDTLSLAA